uniref:Procollagen-lysine, 2-oxoglutarate 5-dioxygenase 2 n=1 Tax=Paramormyrops kingsleyae TaxID=1676925 RepID=A0A3B3QGW2_9TELE
MFHYRLIYFMLADYSTCGTDVKVYLLISDKLLILVAAAPESDGFLCFMQSANYYNYSAEVYLQNCHGYSASGGIMCQIPAEIYTLQMLSLAIFNDIILAGSPEDCLRKCRKFDHKVVVAGLAERERLNITTDDRCEIFQTLSEELGEYLLKCGPEETRVRNAIYDTLPVVIQGNRNTRVNLKQLGNYIPNIWTYKDGCRVCNQDTLDLSSSKVHDLKLSPATVVLSGRTVFLPRCISDGVYFSVTFPHPDNGGDTLSYQHQGCDLCFEIQAIMPGILLLLPSEWTCFSCMNVNLSFPRDLCRRNTECGYYLSVDADVRLTNNRTLRLLIGQNRCAVRRHQSADGYFASSLSVFYFLCLFPARGVWNVPYVAHIYLIKGETLRAELRDGSSFTLERMDSDMALCRTAHQLGIFMYVTNRHKIGRLISTVNYKTSHYNGDLWQIFENPADWKEKYIHPEYSRIFTEDIIEQVYVLSVVHALVGEAENLGKWSDKWLTAGHEPLLASDIHMAQMNFQKEWLFFIWEFISPVIAKVFFGYSTKSYSVVNFIAKHSAEGLASQKTRHDKSTITMSIALSNAGVDFQGGGCKFHRYNCSMKSPKKGWSLMHPGTLTHLRPHYEGLPITSGVQYIATSFIDP